MRFLICFLMAVFFSMPSFAKKYDAEILYDRVILKLFPDGRKVWREEKAVKVYTRKGVSDFGEIVIPFKEKHQKLKLLYVYTELPNGKKLEPSKDAINVVFPPFVAAAPIYSDLRYKTISMPAVKPGATIKYAFEIETFDPFMKNELWDENWFQGTYPVKEASFKVFTPADKYVKFKEYNFNMSPEVLNEGNETVYFYKLTDVPPIDEETSMPPLGEVVKKVKLTSLKSWNQVAFWYSNLAKEALKPTDYVKEKTLEIVKDKESLDDKIKAIYNFVSKNIRYVGLEFGINGYKPHSAESILKNRYGDCKDHATLLIAMLKVIGVKGYPVLIPTSNIENLDVSMPMPGAFDHEIAAIKWKGKWLFLDTTSDFVPFGELPAMDQGRRVLIVDTEEKKGAIETTPVFSSDTNTEGYRGKFKLKKDGSLVGAAEFYYKGVYAHRERAVLSSLKSGKLKRFIEKAFSSVIPGIDINGFKVSDFRDLSKKVVFLKANGEASFYGTTTKHLLLFKMPVPSYSRLINLVASKERHYPFVVGYKMSKMSDVTVYFPDNYKSLFIPEDFYFANRVGSIKLWWEKLGDKGVKLHFSMVLDKPVISANEYKDLRTLFNVTVKTLQNQVVVLKRSK